MKAVIQRVSSASVTIGGTLQAKIGLGFLVLLGISSTDTREDADWLCRKLVGLRIFSDGEGQMNLSLADVRGAILLVSQFTLLAACKKGNRPSFVNAARPEQAVPLYEYVIAMLGDLLGQPVQTGRFGADMQVALVNDGPVTIILDTHNKE